jgi:hypothetical protein
MSPTEEKINTAEQGHDDGATGSHELQGQHGKDAAEKKIGIEKNRKLEIVAYQTGNYQDKEELNTVLAGQEAVY